MASSCAVLQAIVDELAALHRRRPEVEAALGGYRARFGPC